ncbi:MAG: metallophosphoesterase family protein [Gemmatimonadales bacterium]
MRYALLSDIHGNRPALEAVLSNIAARSDVDAMYHLGDLVGYSPWPNEVVDLIRRADLPGVAGNYDSTVATHYKNCGCRYEDPQQEQLSHRSYEWTLGHVSPETTAFLRALPFRIDVRPFGGHVSGPRMALVHAHTSNNLIYVEETRPDAFLSKMADSAGLVKGDVLAFGHTHKPWSREVDGVHFVNTGSVGRPKDGDWRAGYVTVDIAEGRCDVEFIRVEYDVDAAARAIEASELPNEFATFLRTGGKTSVAVPASVPTIG